MIVLYGRGGGMNASLAFQPSFADLGAGIVNTTLTKGSGSATFTRATTAYTKLSTGNWASVASGQPRFCYIGRDTTVQTDGGYFSETAATQLVTPTASIRDMTDASWVATNITPVKNATGITGIANSASTLTATGAAATILQTLVAAATSRTYSAWVRRKTGTGTITLMHGATTLDITALINASTYTRVQLNATQLNAAYGFTIATSGDEIEVDFNQFEAGAEATSPIDTAGATRNADVLSYPSASNIDFTQGACYAEFMLNAPNGVALSGTHHIVSNTSTAFLSILNGSMPTTIRMTDGTTSLEKTGLSSASTSIRKRASSWGTIGENITGDGVAVSAAAFDGSMGPSATISIGVSSATSNSIIKTAQIYLAQPANATLQALTA